MSELLQDRVARLEKALDSIPGIVTKLLDARVGYFSESLSAVGERIAILEQLAVPTQRTVIEIGGKRYKLVEENKD